MAQIESWKNKHIDGFYTKTTQKGFDLIFLCVLTPLSAIFQLYHGYQKGRFSASFV
jgi:hypothetical protein